MCHVAIIVIYLSMGRTFEAQDGETRMSIRAIRTGSSMGVQLPKGSQIYHCELLKQLSKRDDVREVTL